MANVEKHYKNWIEEFSRAEFSIVPTRSRSVRIVGRHIKNRRKAPPYRSARLAPEPRPVILRFDRLPATPQNMNRIRGRIQDLNRRLEQAGVPLRLRIV